MSASSTAGSSIYEYVINPNGSGALIDPTLGLGVALACRFQIVALPPASGDTVLIGLATATNNMANIIGLQVAYGSSLAMSVSVEGTTIASWCP